MTLARAKPLAVMLSLVLSLALVSSSLAQAPAASTKVFLPLMDNQFQAPFPSSAELIDQAVGRGEIGQETGLVYKVFAIFGDSRLPAVFQGDNRHQDGTRLMGELTARWDTLSSTAQQLLLPFTLPPNHPDSWYALRNHMPALTRSTGSTTVHNSTDDPGPNPYWPNVEAVNGKALIWYPWNIPEGHELALGLKTALEMDIWNQETELMGQEPFSDSGVPGSIGGTGQYDIFIVSGLNAYAVTKTYGDCEHTPSYILVDYNASQPDRRLGDFFTPGMMQALAHEFMHALQYNYEVAEPCSSYDWLAEATAVWTEDFIYPLAGSEQIYVKSFLDTAKLELENLQDDRHYGAYLLPFFLTKTYGDNQIIKRMWDNSQSVNSLAAVNDSVDGQDFESFWGLFAMENWNQAPFNRIYEADRMDYRLKPEGGRAVPVRVTSGGVATYPLPGDLEHLSARYYHFTFPDNSARMVTFLDGLFFELSQGTWEGGTYVPADSSQMYQGQLASEEKSRGARIYALYKLEGQDWQLADWSAQGRVSFCRDKSSERLEELVVITSNSAYQDPNRDLKPANLPPTLLVSNQGCYGWEGTSKVTTHYLGTTEVVEATSSRYLLPEGMNMFAQSFPMLDFQLESAQLHWEISGVRTTDGCTLEGSQDLTVYHESGHGPEMELLPGLISGPSFRRFTTFAHDTTGQEVTYHVSCPDGDQYDVTTTPTGFFETPIDTPALISASGTQMQGSATTSDGAGEHTFEWNLTAITGD